MIKTLLLFTVLVSPVLQAEEVLIESRGLTLNAQLEMAEGKTYGDGIVLILHGILGHNRMEIMATAQQALLDNGQSSLAINLSLGIDNRHGFYDCDTPHVHLQDDAFVELDAWINWLQARKVKDITLMAHSRGGNQVMVYAVDRETPEIKRLVLLAPTTVFHPRKVFEGRFDDSYEPAFKRAKKLVDAGKGKTIMQDTDFIYCPKSAVSAESFLSYYGEKTRFHDFPLYLQMARIPVLITLGTLDETQPDAEQQIFPYADGKRVRLQLIEGAGHFFRDFNIDEAIESAVKFIESGRV